MTKVCVVAAGGTGGHMFPAEALARELTTRGWRVILATDARGQQYASAFPAEERIALDAATGRGPLGLLKAGMTIMRGVGQAKSALDRLGADVVVGFGGYPSAPALLAAITTRRPTVIHEQNAVLGRTNRYLAPSVQAIGSAFPTLGRAKAQVKDRVTLIGNPVRAEIQALFGRDWQAPAADGPIHVLVTGGSQGARLLSETTPRALAALPSVLIPLKIATDDHQTLNARALVDAGAAEMLPEDAVTVDSLAAVLERLLSDPARLAAMSAAARSVAIPDATSRLANLVEATAR